MEIDKTKSKCGKCGRELVHEREVYSCSYDCTFCYECAREMNFICPNCSGKLGKKIKHKN